MSFDPRWLFHSIMDNSLFYSVSLLYIHTSHFPSSTRSYGHIFFVSKKRLDTNHQQCQGGCNREKRDCRDFSNKKMKRRLFERESDGTSSERPYRVSSVVRIPWVIIDATISSPHSDPYTWTLKFYLDSHIFLYKVIWVHFTINTRYVTYTIPIWIRNDRDEEILSSRGLSTQFLFESNVRQVLQ